MSTVLKKSKVLEHKNNFLVKVLFCLFKKYSLGIAKMLCCIFFLNEAY